MRSEWEESSDERAAMTQSLILFGTVLNPVICQTDLNSFSLKLYIVQLMCITEQEERTANVAMQDMRSTKRVTFL